MGTEITRRDAIVAGAAAVPLVAAPWAGTQAEPRQPPDADTIDITLQINGSAHALRIDPRTSLLDALREHAGLTGSKKGCDMGSCGACTVHVDGKRVVSCLIFAQRVQGKQITTIEGLGSESALHPLQAAFVEHDAMQCGYCTPGQIMSAAALMHEGHTRSNDEIREWMSGNLCRCGAYPNIVAAIRDMAAVG